MFLQCKTVIRQVKISYELKIIITAILRVQLRRTLATSHNSCNWLNTIRSLLMLIVVSTHLQILAAVTLVEYLILYYLIVICNRKVIVIKACCWSLISNCYSKSIDICTTDYVIGQVWILRLSPFRLVIVVAKLLQWTIGQWAGFLMRSAGPRKVCIAAPSLEIAILSDRASNQVISLISILLVGEIEHPFSIDTLLFIIIDQEIFPCQIFILNSIMRFLSLHSVYLVINN